VATKLYLSLPSRTGSLKCGRFIDAIGSGTGIRSEAYAAVTAWLSYDEKDEKSVDRMKKTSPDPAIGNATSPSWFMISRPDSRRCRSGYGRAHVRNDIRRDRSAAGNGWCTQGKAIHLEPDIGPGKNGTGLGHIERSSRFHRGINETVSHFHSFTHN